MVIEKGTVASVTLAVEYPNQPLEISDPALVTIGRYDYENDWYRVYWGLGRSFAFYRYSQGHEVDNSFSIIKVYGHEDEDRDFYVEFDRDNPPQESIPDEQSNGWISPDGKWYACASGGHDGLAVRLSSIFYDGSDHGRYDLQDKGWINIYDSGLLPYGVKPTDEQKKLLTSMLCLGDREWRKYIIGYLRHWERKENE